MKFNAILLHSYHLVCSADVLPKLMRYCLNMEFYADITVFDADTIQDNATFEVPNQYVTGMPHVFIIGKQAVKNGEHTGHIQEKWSEAQDGMENNNQKNEIN